MFFSRCLKPLALALLLTGCSRVASGPPPGFAFVRFENLSGDSSLEWLGRAASEVLATSLTGALEGPVIAGTSISRLELLRGSRPPGAPGISSQRSALILAGAKRMISGYFERVPGGIRVEATEEDVTTGKTVRIVNVTGAANLDTILQLARKLSSGAHPYLTSNNEALRLYTTALETSQPLAEDSLRQAIAADPSFGPAWTMAVRVALLQNRRDDALRLVADSQAQKLDPLSRATLKLDGAALAGDEKARLAALTEVIELSPGDTTLLRQLAESKTASGQFAEAAAAWLRLSKTLRDDPDVWNQMGYTRAWAGDYNGALAAMADYARIRPKDANPFDSRGDIQYLYRKYGEAAASYLESFAKDPSMQLGASLYKAAWAKFYAGDRAGGDKLMDQLRVLREKANVTNFHLFQTDWFYRTGRQKEAVALLRKEMQAGSGKVAEAQQLVVWDLLAGDRAAAAKDMTTVGPAKDALSAIIHFVAMPSAPAAEWQRRAETMLPGPQNKPIRNLALGYALLLDGKKQESLPVWEQIIASTPPGEFAFREILTKLQGGKPKLAVVPNPNGVNQFAGLIDKL